MCVYVCDVEGELAIVLGTRKEKECAAFVVLRCGLMPMMTCYVCVSLSVTHTHTHTHTQNHCELAFEIWKLVAHPVRSALTVCTPKQPYKQPYYTKETY